MPAIAPTPEALAVANPADVEEIIRSTGFYKNKTRSLIGMANALVDRFDGDVPTRMADWVTVPGVGRKTANVVRSVAQDLPGMPVDTHMLRLSRRLGLTHETDPVKVELALNPMVPANHSLMLGIGNDLEVSQATAANPPDLAHPIDLRFVRPGLSAWWV